MEWETGHDLYPSSLPSGELIRTSDPFTTGFAFNSHCNRTPCTSNRISPNSSKLLGAGKGFRQKHATLQVKKQIYDKTSEI
jgi:hypothetical protein